MTIHLGNVPASSTLYIPFASYGKTNGESITMTNYVAGDIKIYKDGGTTERASTSGFTATTDFDSVTGLHAAIIDLSDNTTAGFYAVGSFYWVVISVVTIDTQTVTLIAATFRIVAAEAVAGKPKVDVDAWLGTAAATPTVNGVPEVDVTHWIGTAAATPTVNGVPEVDVTHWIGTAAATPTVNGVPEVDVTHWIGTAAATPTTAGVPEVDITFINGESIPAINLQKATASNCRGVVGSASTTTSIVTSTFLPASIAVDQFKGRIVTFDRDTATTALRGQATDITASSINAGLPVLTVTTLTTAPASGDTFSVT